MKWGRKLASLILGTAGHIDHGKTELVRALTGTDTDRLKEEKERGEREKRETWKKGERDGGERMEEERRRKR